MTRKRSGFTLVELLVVIGILMILFALGLAILPGIYQKWEVIKGAEMVQGALARARQEARRSGRPTGIRMVARGSQVTNLTLIQQAIDANVAPNAVALAGYFVPEGAGLPTKSVGPTLKYFQVREPSPIWGERDIQLPEKVAVDIPLCSLNGFVGGELTPTGVDAGGNTYYDIVFGPGGGLTMDTWPGNQIFLWVRDVRLNDPTKGYPTLICIKVRTGYIAAHPVNPDPAVGPPYIFGLRPESSGL